MNFLFNISNFLFNIIWIKNFYINNIIKKVVCMVFDAYIFGLITQILIYIIST